MYKYKFQKNIVKNVAEKNNLNEEHVYLIYISIEKAIVALLSDPFTERIMLPLIGRFQLSVKRLKTIEKKLVRTQNYLSSKVDRILEFNFEFLANVRYYINKFSHNNN